MKFIFFSSRDWNLEWQRTHHLAIRLSDTWPLLYIDPVGLRKINISDYSRIFRRLTRVFKANSSNTNFGNVSLFSPIFYLPLPYHNLANRLNAIILKTRIDSYLRGEEFIVWISYPSAVIEELLKALAPKLVIYDCLDEFHLFHNNQDAIKSVETSIVAQSDLVFASANTLYQRMLSINRNTHLVPNGVEVERYSTISDSFIPPDMINLSRPIIGYVGGISDWFDFKLISDIARDNPTWQFTLIGPVDVARVEGLSEYKDICKRPNVHFLGLKKYTKIPAYINMCDAMIIPFKINQLTRSVDPLKVYEYLAAGKPVVATKLPELEKFKDVVNIAYERNTFSDRLKQVVENDNKISEIRKRQEVVKDHTWDNRIVMIKESIQLTLNQKY